MGFSKKLKHIHHVVSAPRHIVHEIGHAASKVAHEVGHASSNVAHEVGKGVNTVAHTGEKIVKAPKKIIRSMVKDKIKEAYEKKMLEAIDHVENELAERKAQDKAQMDQAIAIKLKEAAEKYIELNGKKVLEEAEIQFTEMLRDITAAVHDCRFGFKESVEEILSLDFDDYRVIQFLEKRPLVLTLQNFDQHQNGEALSILLPYFDKNLNQLSAENKADYIFIKEYAGKKLGNKAEKTEAEAYFTNLVQLLTSDAKAGLIKVTNNTISAVSSTASIAAQLNPTGIVSLPPLATVTSEQYYKKDAAEDIKLALQNDSGNATYLLQQAKITQEQQKQVVSDITDPAISAAPGR